MSSELELRINWIQQVIAQSQLRGAGLRTLERLALEITLARSMLEHRIQAATEQEKESLNRLMEFLKKSQEYVARSYFLITSRSGKYRQHLDWEWRSHY